MKPNSISRLITFIIFKKRTLNLQGKSLCFILCLIYPTHFYQCFDDVLMMNSIRDGSCKWKDTEIKQYLFIFILC